MEYTRVLIIGENETAPYHPLNNIIEELTSLINPSYKVDVIEGTKILLSDLSIYNIIITYSDRWLEDVNPTHAEGITNYITSGGRVIFLHTGICLANNPSVEKLAGGKFIDHPPIDTIEMIPDNTHPICEGIEPFELFEEPYIYQIHPDVVENKQITIFMDYKYKETLYPAAWLINLQKGVTINLHPGHHVDVFKNERYRTILKRSISYLINLPN